MNKKMSKSALTLMAVALPVVAVVGGTVTQPIEAEAKTTYYDLHGKFVKKSGKIYFQSKVMGLQRVAHGKGGLNDDHWFWSASNTGKTFHVKGYGSPSSMVITKVY
ncbi:hypothetical protein CVD28_03195 [Bacillus sp. M6-12]|uniref:hypothetical protein n=1 Tax=Bacillus sp. M6-12 TaxID=2054166 RepID=UPI000C7851D1|nr:hypothetical protein [Bacillus sp. M6-12]PLS19436.1 hypothetical protein CVD28_03195 [Bacillus sp. M6-12]